MSTDLPTPRVLTPADRKALGAEWSRARLAAFGCAETARLARTAARGPEFGGDLASHYAEDYA